MRESDLFGYGNSIHENYCSVITKLESINLDCSEIVEDFISDFGGRALLILSKGWKSQKSFAIHKSNRSEDSFIYHYAWISRGSLVYDPMLGYEKTSLLDYLTQIEVNEDEVEIKIISSKSLRCYI